MFFPDQTLPDLAALFVDILIVLLITVIKHEIFINIQAQH